MLGLLFTVVTLQVKSHLCPCSLPLWGGGDGERFFIDRARREVELASGGLPAVRIISDGDTPRPLYGFFRLVAGGARHGGHVTAMLIFLSRSSCSRH